MAENWVLMRVKSDWIEVELPIKVTPWKTPNTRDQYGPATVRRIGLTRLVSLGGISQ